MKSEVKVTQSCPDSLRPHGLYSPWNSPGQNTGVGSLSLLQGIFPTQGSNPGLPHYRWILYQLSHQGSPRILEWVAYPFSSRSSQPRNRTGVSCIAGRFFTNWAIQWANGKLITDWISSYPTIVHQKKPHTYLRVHAFCVAGSVAREKQAQVQATVVCSRVLLSKTVLSLGRHTINTVL